MSNGLDDIKQIKELAKSQFLQSDTQSANTFILVASIFLAVLTPRIPWTIVNQISILSSIILVALGVAIILVQRFQVKTLLDYIAPFHDQLERVELEKNGKQITDEQYYKKILAIYENAKIPDGIGRARKFLNQAIWGGYTIFIVSLVFLMLSLSGK